jgi:photosystem II stability/assembly factor-like uncharacterized protein
MSSSNRLKMQHIPVSVRLADVPRRILPFALLALVAGACSGDRHAFLEPLKVESAGQMTFRFTPPPRSEGPALGAEHLFFIDGRRGFVATTGGGGYQQHVGYNLPTEPGRIQITNDGGRTWRTVWARRNVVFQSISFADRTTGLAVGSALDLRGYRGAGDPPSHTLLMRTRDGGRTWRALKPRPAFGPHFFLGEYSSPTIPDDHGFQLAGATTWYAFGRETRRSRDGGQTWVKVPMPPGATLLQFPSADVGYAAAKSPRCGGQQLWKTTDGARSWSPLSGTCTASYMSIDFLDERKGFTSAGPREDYSYEKPQLVIRATTDGGLSWETRYLDPSQGVGRDDHWPAPTQLHFLDKRNGWAVSHEISQGWTFDDLHVTRDGGRHWQRRWFPSWQLPSAFAAGGRAWATNHWTTDWGRTWRMSVRPGQITPYRLRVATKTRLVVETGQGVIESRDTGQTWSTRTPLSDRRAAEAMGLPAYIRTRSGAEGDTGLPVSSNDRRLQVPKRFYTGAVAFRTEQRGLLAAGDPSDARVPIFATHDGGQSWRRLKMPAGVSEDAEVRLGPELAVIVTGYPGLLLTTDEGRHWSKVPVNDDYWECGAQKFGDGPYWLLCQVDFTRGRTVLFRSDDGEHWRSRSSRIRPSPNLMTSGPDEAWTIGSKALWHTTDGGDSWRQVWPTLRPGVRAYNLGHFRAAACC